MSFWDMISGKAARKDIDKGIAAVNQGQQQAADAFTTYGNQATDRLALYRDQGGDAFTRRNSLLDVNGAAARDAAFADYNNNPGFAAQRALDLTRSGRAMNAGGNFTSGTAALADARIRTENLNNYINQLGGVAQQGQSAASQTAGIDQGTGAGVAGTYQNAAGQTANLYGQRAQTQNTLPQNLLGAAGVVASLAGAPNFGVNRLGQTSGNPNPGPAQTPWYNPSRWFG